jgi:hypothetical protein
VNDEEREYLNEMIRGLNSQLVDALRERDEARRMYCRQTADSLEHYREPERIADDRGWDCFSKENVK